MGLRRLLARLFRRRSKDPLALTETIKVRVSPVELGMFQMDARHLGLTLDQWARDKLNRGISTEMLLHLSKGHDQSALRAAFALSTAENVIPLAPRRTDMADAPKIYNGHPCRFLDPSLPQNMTRAECQGHCTSRKPGWNGRPCYWGPTAAKNCDEFQTKINLPLGNPGVR